MSDFTTSCECQSAVLRTFAELRERRVPEPDALESAATVLVLRHPEIGAKDALNVVARWLDT